MPACMKLAALLATTAAAAFAGAPLNPPQPPGRTTPEPFVKFSTTYGFEADYDRGGSGTMWESRAQIGALWELPNIPLPGRNLGMWHLRLGLEHHRFEFDHDSALPLPERLQSYSAIIGLELRVEGRVGALLEVRPGVFFENDVGSGAFDCPVKLGLGYRVNDSLALTFMGRYNGFAKYPFLGGIGAVWQITPTLTFSAIFPEPRLEWRAASDLSLWLGGEWAGGGYRTDERRGRGRAVVDYTDYRVSLGASWTPGVWTIEASGGLSLEREWDFHKTDRRYHTDEVSPFVKLAVRAQW
jgi:hypothetical protein